MGTFGLLFFNISIKLINPSDAVALFFTNIIIVSVLARIIFKEKFTIAHIVALIAMIFGIGLISQPSFLVSKSNLNNSLTNSINMSNYTFKSLSFISSSSFIYVCGVASAITAASFASCVVIALKKLANKKVHFSVIILFAAYVGLPVSFVFALTLLLTGFVTKNENELKDSSFILVQLAYACISALMGCGLQITINLSYKYDDASKISIYRTMDLIFTFLMQYFLLNIKSNEYSMIGSLLIILGNILVLGFKIMDSNESTTKLSECEKNSKTKTNKCTSVKRIVFIKF